jgi:predicted aspartyl protease
VIAVTFNGNQTYEMILDTGASGTLITSAMASSLGIRSVGQTSVDTASAQGVSFSLGYVDSMDVGGAVAHNVLVAMGGPELSLGLLGHDFFGNYDIVIRETEVEFRER